MIAYSVNYFAKKGYDVSIILRRNIGEYLTTIPESVKIIPFSTQSKTKIISELVKVLKKEQFDIAFTVTPSLNTYLIISRALAKCKTKVVINEPQNTLTFFFKTKFSLQKLSYLTIPLFYRFADGIIAISKGVGENLRKIALVPPQRIHIIYYPSFTEENLERSEQPIEHEWFKSTETIPVVIGLGRLVKVKNFQLLINAVKIVSEKRPVRLMILGHGVLMDELQAQINDLNLNDFVRLEGFKLDTVTWLNKADVFVLSSNYEGFGMVVVEALTAGTTVVATDCNFGPAEILENGKYGYLVPVGDVKAMADKIEFAIDHPMNSEVLIDRAREFGVDTVMPQYEKLFLSLVEGKSNN